MTISKFKELIKPFKQGYVAQQMGISQAYLSQVLKGKQVISRKTAAQMAKFVENHECSMKNNMLKVK